MVLKCDWNDGHPGRDLASLDGEVTAHQFAELAERMITVDHKLTREQLDQVTEQRRQLAELHQRRQQLLPADFPAPGAG